MDAVIGLGPNLFYNATMESCLLICRMKKPKERKGKVIFIDAKDEIRNERSAAYLKPEHIKRISDTYWKFKDVDGFAKVVSNKELLSNSNNGNLSVQLFVKQINNNQQFTIEHLLEATKNNQKELNTNIDNLFKQLKKLGIE